MNCLLGGLGRWGDTVLIYSPSSLPNSWDYRPEPTGPLEKDVLIKNK